MMNARPVEDIVDVLRAIQQAAGRSVGGKLGGRFFMREAEAAGHHLSSQTIDRLLAEKGRTPDPKTLAAIAAVGERYGISAGRVYATEGVPPPTGDFAKALPLGVDGLSKKTRDALVTVLESLVDTEVRASNVVDLAERQTPAQPSAQRRKAARTREKGQFHGDEGRSSDS